MSVPSEDTQTIGAEIRDRSDRGSFRLLVVDDHATYRSVVSDLFSLLDSVASVEQADSVRSALLEMERSEPDLVVMDVHMPVTNGIDGALEVLRRYPEARVALCSTSQANELPELLSLPFESGRVTFVTKGDLEPDMIMTWLIGSDAPTVGPIDVADS
jgi:two-component system, NarL family, vancomycin resistance associated response regulator VraR